MKLIQLTLIALAAGAAQTAFAHAELSASTPANCARVQSAPDNVTLNFSEPVRLTALSVQKDGAAKQSLGPLPAGVSQQFVVAAPALEDGHYVVSWRALSADTHVMTGEFMFAVGATGAHAQHTSCTADASSHEQHPAQGRAGNVDALLPLDRPPPRALGISAYDHLGDARLQSRFTGIADATQEVGRK